MTKILLNLGCGDRLVNPPGDNWQVVNHDKRRHKLNVDVVWDLDSLPWPWADGSVATIYAWQVLEHLTIPLWRSFNECWRIVKPGGLLTVNLPLWGADNSHTDPSHRWWVTETTFDFFDPSRDLGRRYGTTIYGWKPWTVVNVTRANEASVVAVLKSLKGERS